MSDNPRWDLTVSPWGRSRPREDFVEEVRRTDENTVVKGLRKELVLNRLKSSMVFRVDPLSFISFPETIPQGYSKK